MIPILFDTDLGSDIDDAVALAYLVKQPHCELLGITTVSGNTAQRAALGEIICRAAGRDDIPIHAGLDKPLLFGPGQPHVPQYEAIHDLPHRTEYAITAIDFLRETIRSRPGEITLLAVGPMTNIGALFASDPEIPSLLKSLVLMCGVYTGRAGHGPGATEWNATRDPVATALVYQQGAGKLLGVGLDVTMLCRMPADQCRSRFLAAGGPLAAVAPMAEVWFRRAPEVTFHDPLAAALLFDPDICTYAEGEASIPLYPESLAGMTYWKSGKREASPHRIAVTVDKDRFFDHYFAITGG
jgi:purine nucleosidase